MLANYHPAWLCGGGRGGITQMRMNISAQQTWKRLERAWKEIQAARLFSLINSCAPGPPPPAPRRAPLPATPARTATARPGPTLPRCSEAVASAVIAPGAVRADTTAGRCEQRPGLSNRRRAEERPNRRPAALRVPACTARRHALKAARHCAQSTVGVVVRRLLWGGTGTGGLGRAGGAR